MTELTEAQKTVYNKAVKEYDIKFKTWAIDRALEIIKTPGCELPKTAQTIVEQANTLCDWIMLTPKFFPIPTQDEASAMVEQMKAMGEIV